MMSNVAFTGFSNICIVDEKKSHGQKATLVADVNNFDYHDYFVLQSLPERFIDKKHPEKMKLNSFKTRNHKVLMLNGQLLDVNHANKDVVSPVVLLLRRMKKEMPYIDLKCFIEEHFLDQLAPKEYHPTKDALNATGKFFKNIGKGFAKFIFY